MKIPMYLKNCNENSKNEKMKKNRSMKFIIKLMSEYILSRYIIVNYNLINHKNTILAIFLKSNKKN